MTVIGKADKFWTLWDKSANGATAVYTYCKNISTGLDKALAEYPGSEVLPWLRGKGTYTVDEARPSEDLVPGVMFFGKHAGKNVSDIPASYLAWVLENFAPDSPKKYDWALKTFPEIIRILEASGYEVSGDLDSRFSAVLVSSILEEPEFVSGILSNEPVKVEASSNPNSEGDFVCGNVIFRFPEVKEMWYNGFPYYLPAVNGKTRRVKGKLIEVSEYDLAEVKNGFFGNSEGTYRRVFYVNIKKWNLSK